VWKPTVHTGSWRAVWAYSTKRAVRDSKTLTLQESRPKDVVAGNRAARTPRFVKTTNGARALDEAARVPGFGTRGTHQYWTVLTANGLPRAR
jgi:hypothetical protein